MQRSAGQCNHNDLEERGTPLLKACYGRMWIQEGPFRRNVFHDVVLAATESVEAWIIDLMEKAGACALFTGAPSGRLATDIGAGGWAPER